MRLWPFEPARAVRDAVRLVEAVTRASREPSFFGEGRVPDTLDGRFELLALIAALALMRLRAAPGAEPLAQEFTDLLFRHLDSGLREAGVGDLTVPKRMRKLAGDFYGRLGAYASALAADAAPDALEQALARNIHSGAGFLPEFAARVRAQHERLSAATIEQILDAEAWHGPHG